MADFNIPLNRVGVVDLALLDQEGFETFAQMDSSQWEIGFGSDKFSIIVAADGRSAEIHPIAVGSGSLSISIGKIGNSAVTQSRSIEIISNASDTGPSGNYPEFAGTRLSIVHNIGEVV